MKTEQQLTCIKCPLGCQITVTIDEKGEHVTGAQCKNGEIYALQEVKQPERVVISVIPCEQSSIPTVSVKTSKPVPKDQIFSVMNLLSNVRVTAPVSVGDIILHNILGLSIDIIATRNAPKIVS